MQGFGAFRAETVIDFSDDDLVALTGPTGAGKSTIIDGIAFALYGSVARYANEKLVAPIVNAVSNEARVRLDFTVQDTAYTAVRIVRRAANGASTKEARLESGDEVLASTAAELTTAVTGLVGLSFKQFTKTVVLPQGEFAQFLHVKPSVRQRLLRHMLGLDLYAEVGKAARRRARDIKAQTQAFEKTMDDRTRVTKKQLDVLRDTVDALEADVAAIDVATEERTEALDALAEATTAIDDVNQQLEALALLAVPKEAKTFATTSAAADKAVATAKKRADAAEAKHQKHHDARAELPSDEQLSALLARREEQQALVAEKTTLAEAARAAIDTLDSATAAATNASECLAASETALANARTMAGAQGIAAGLHVGEDCPVCRQLVESLPDLDSNDAHATAVTDAEVERERARGHAEEVLAQVHEATASRADTSARLDAIEARVATATVELEDEPTLKQALALQKRAAAADEKVNAASDAAIAAGQVLDDAAAKREESVASEAAMRREFTIARDAVAVLSPPTPSEESLHDDWVALTAWGKATVKDVRAQVREHEKKAAAASKAAKAAEKILIKLGTAHFAPNTIVDADRVMAMTRNAHADARLAFANAQDRYERVQRLQDEIGDLDVAHTRAQELGRHLMSGMFERWIMGDVMDDLATRAAERLLELSGGAYSLVTDGRDFQIRDHRNADEIRNTRTLSGGETFLTSLALALSLTDSIADLATSSSPPLESMFLDEGFGTLDPETLDTVATAIEDLGASGRLIGVITHISDLADRLPTQIRVQPGPSGSTVTRRTK